MNVLRAASSHAFLVQQFVAADKTPHFYQAITINTSATGSVHQETKDLSAKEVHDFIRDSPPEDSVSFFRLISFDSENGLVMCVTRDLFSDVFSTFGIDEYCKFLICKRAVCFHMSRRQGALQTFYLGLKSCRVIYTYHLLTRSTNAIVIQDRDVSPTTNPLTNLPIQIRQSANLAIHPCFLPCVSAVALLLFARDALKHVLGGIVVFGRSLGVDVWTSNVLSHDLTTTEQLLKLGNMMDLMEPVLGELDYIRRFFTVVHQLLDGMTGDDVRSLLSSMDKDPLLQKADDEVKEVMKIAHNQIDAEDKVMSYWMERGKNQISMIFNMVNRGDVLASIQLAKAASRDSSAMKIIAVMTMVFLPATFFAALFAVPTLRWDEESIVSDRFWIYWAFTLPTTALVFIVWLVITQRKGIIKWLKKKSE